jgi:hypothetical protein
MSSPEAPGAGVLPVAIAQLRMRRTGEENTRQIVSLLARAADEGAQVCVLPELALTGFHRQIRREASAAQVQRWVARVAQGCAAHSIAAFARGTRRDAHAFVGRRCAAVPCREIEDLAELSAQLPAHGTDLIFWPGAMRPAVDGTRAPNSYIEHAQALARATAAWVVQANWPNCLPPRGERRSRPQPGHRCGRRHPAAPADGRSRAGRVRAGRIARGRSAAWVAVRLNCLWP